jgi:hypothetical protein
MIAVPALMCVVTPSGRTGVSARIDFRVAIRCGPTHQSAPTTIID